MNSCQANLFSMKNNKYIIYLKVSSAAVVIGALRIKNRRNQRMTVLGIKTTNSIILEGHDGPKSLTCVPLL